MSHAHAHPHTGHVFGLGLSKTGTHSLNAALDRLGWPSIHYPDPALMLASRFDEALEGHRAATDISVSAVFRELDVAFPGSKFILTIRRDSDRWLASIGDHYRRREDELAGDTSDARFEVRRRVYGIKHFDADHFRRAAAQFEQMIQSHFSPRPDDLLILDPCAGEGYDLLCPFLGVPTIDEPFPRRNVRPPHIPIIVSRGPAHDRVAREP